MHPPVPYAHLEHPSFLPPSAPIGGAAGSPASRHISGFLKGGLGSALPSTGTRNGCSQ